MYIMFILLLLLKKPTKDLAKNNIKYAYQFLMLASNLRIVS